MHRRQSRLSLTSHPHESMFRNFANVMKQFISYLFIYVSQVGLRSPRSLVKKFKKLRKYYQVFQLRAYL